MVVLARSIAVPSNSLCVRGDLDSSIKDSLKRVLLSMHNTHAGKNALKAMNALRFKETTDSEFDALKEMAKDLDIDIRTYPFRDKR